LKIDTPRSNEPLISVLSIRVSVALPMAPPVRPVLLGSVSKPKRIAPSFVALPLD
jgi:hypothetical protein